jgi:hypothetical protein
MVYRVLKPGGKLISSTGFVNRETLAVLPVEMAAVMICLGKERDSDTDLLKLLNVLLSTETGSQDKCQILEEDFQIRMTLALESEVSLMCNLSKGVEEKGIEKGRQEGKIAMVSALKDLQIADSIILNKIQEKFHLAEETAKMYL